MDSDRLIYFERTPRRRPLDPEVSDTVDFAAPVHALVAQQAMSQMFEVRVEWEHEDRNLEIEPLLHRTAVVDIGTDHEPRYFHGVVDSVSFLRSAHSVTIYETTLRPAAQRLAYRFGTRVFRDLGTPDIVRALLEEVDQRVDLRIHGSYRTFDYLVQYQESDLAFASRLLEEAGIFYWFEHTSSAHVLHLADSVRAYRPVDGPTTLRFDEGRSPGDTEVGRLRFTSRVTHDVHVSRDWNWQRPNAPIEAEHAHGGARRFERYEHRAEILDEGEARQRARVHQEANSVRRHELRGISGNVHVTVGRTFTLIGARPDAINLDYLITSVRRDVRPDGSRELVEFSAIPSTRVFRAERKTAVPRLGGRETAFITGPLGSEIHVDPLGQAKALLYWDHQGPRDERSSRWIRVAQPNTVGSMYLPRVGYEVAVAYVNGDPSRPLITHRHYNDHRPPPYDLPRELSKTTFQSESTPGGGGSNEIRFDDTNGRMELYIHAQRDFDVRAGHDRTEAVGITSVEEVTGELQTSVGGMENITVGIDQRRSVNKRVRLSTGEDKTVAVAQLDNWDVRDNHTITNDGDRRESIAGPAVAVARAAIARTVNGARQRTIGGANFITVGGGLVEAVARNKQEQSGARVSLVRGAHTEEIGGDKTLRGCTARLHSRGPFAVSAAALGTHTSDALTIEVTEAVGAAGAAVSVLADDRLCAKAGGSELVLSGSTLDVDASAFAASAGVVRLIGQIETIEPDSAETPEPPEPGPEDDWIEISLLDENGEPVGGERYVIRLPDGSERSGTLDSRGHAREEGLVPGTVTVSFPDLSGAEDGDGA